MEMDEKTRETVRVALFTARRDIQQAMAEIAKAKNAAPDDLYLGYDLDDAAYQLEGLAADMREQIMALSVAA